MFKTSLNKSYILVFLGTVLLTSCGGGAGEYEADGAQSSSQGEGAASEGILNTTASSGSSSEEFWLGEPRDDLERFYGLYGDAGDPGRGFFVSEARRPKWAEQAPEMPPGYLMMGAMWGDVAPWYMKALSETRFQQETLGDFKPPEPVVVEFEIDENGKAVAITFSSVFKDRGRLERLGDVPEE